MASGNTHLRAHERHETTRAGESASHGGDTDRRFFSGMAIATSATIFAGFSQSYYLKTLTPAPPLPLFVHVHAAVFTCWLILFITQTMLVASNRVQTHRKLGIAGVALAAIMIVVGLATAILAAKLGYKGSPGLEARDAQTFLIVPFRDITLFAVFVTLGIYFRRKARLHKRMMLLAVVGALMPAGISRLPGINHFPPVIGVIFLLFILACPIYDFTCYRRVDAPYLCGALVSALLVAPITERVALSPIWFRFADWLIH